VAVDGTSIASYGYIQRRIDCELRRDFDWRFIVASVLVPIIGVDFLTHYNLLVDVVN